MPSLQLPLVEMPLVVVKFSLMGSVIGAYTIQALTTVLYGLNVSADQLPVYKAIVVVVIVVLQSPVFKKFIAVQKEKNIKGCSERRS